MAEAFTGEIRLFAGDFAPRGWQFCDGQLIAISQNEVLFSLLGTLYGGDGRSTFALPDMRGRVSIHQGTGIGLTTRPMGQRMGLESVTIIDETMPTHSHILQATNTEAKYANPVGKILANASNKFYDDGEETTTVSLSSEAVGNSGDTESHINMMPCLCVNYIICLNSIYPNRN